MTDILDVLLKERARIDKAIAMFQGDSTSTPTRAKKKASSTNGRKKRKPMSAEARAKIAAAQKARWAKQKK